MGLWNNSYSSLDWVEITIIRAQEIHERNS